VIWRDGRIHKINAFTLFGPENYTSAVANDINNLGQIVGTVKYDNGYPDSGELAFFGEPLLP